MGRKSPMGVVLGEWEITVGTIVLSPSLPRKPTMGGRNWKTFKY